MRWTPSKKTSNDIGELMTSGYCSDWNYAAKKSTETNKKRISIDFDSVWINGLLKKLHQSGVKSKHLKLIADILKNRHLSIQIGNENTDCFGTKIERPQRSVISPILFIFLSVTCSTRSEVQIRRLWKPARDSKYWTSTANSSWTNWKSVVWNFLITFKKWKAKFQNRWMC